MSSTPDITTLLKCWHHGDEAAFQQLVELVYPRLHQLSAQALQLPSAPAGLRPTELVHDLYVKLVGQAEVDWRSRAQFFGLAARLIRRILLDLSRREASAKRGGGLPPITLVEDPKQPLDAQAVQIQRLHDGLHELEKLDPRMARMVELKYFAGLKTDELAEVLGMSPATIFREWKTAKAWLFRYLKPANPKAP